MNDCKNCGYFWYDEAEGFEMCHYPEDEPHQWAPCEANEESDRIAREEEFHRREMEIIEEEYMRELEERDYYDN